MCHICIFALNDRNATTGMHHVTLHLGGEKVERSTTLHSTPFDSIAVIPVSRLGWRDVQLMISSA